MKQISFEIDNQVIAIFPGNDIDDIYGTERWEEFSTLLKSKDEYKWTPMFVTTDIGCFSFIAVIDKSK